MPETRGSRIYQIPQIMTQKAAKPDFDRLLENTKPDQLKLPTLRQLILAAGAKPSEEQLEAIAETIDSSPIGEALMFEVLGTVELATRDKDPLLILKPSLWKKIAFCYSKPLPQKQEEWSAWIESQWERSITLQALNERTKGIILVLLACHTNPDIFLKCLTAARRFLVKPPDKHPGQRDVGVERGSGVTMHDVARFLFKAGKGDLGKNHKLEEVLDAIGAVQEHFREKDVASEAANRKLAEIVGSLAEERRIKSEQARSIRDKDAEILRLQAIETDLSLDVAQWKERHSKSLNHTSDEVTEMRHTVHTSLKLKIKPKISDIRRYTARPKPEIEQILRLLGEVDQILEQEERH